jgi:uncharacterized membrane protein YgcG
VNEEDMEAVEPLAGEELERMLARYARVRLEPSQAFARRARSAVMEEAWRARLDPQSVLRAPGVGSVAAAAAPARRRPFMGWRTRRIALALAAATLAGLMLGSSVFAASRAGGPLYESRLALEDLTLPADPAARAAAQLAHADARLGEAVEAGFRHDDRAVSAALDGYDQAIEDLSTASGAAASDALAAIQLHRSVLLQLATQVPSTATNGIDLALANGNRVSDRLAEAGAGGPGTGGNNGSPQGNGGGAANGAGNAGGGASQGGGSAGGNGSGNANGAGNGNGSNPAAGTPAPTARPTPVATATPTEKPVTVPQSSHEPDRTPKPHRTPAPPNDQPPANGGTPPPTGSDGP